MRFGNKAFRTFHEKTCETFDEFHRTLLSKELYEEGAQKELNVYLTESFGSKQRIDYGTGNNNNYLTQQK